METDASFTEVDLKPEKIEDVKHEDEKYHCDLCDKDLVHKIALALLEGLSSACVDMTTGDIFKSPGTIAAEIRKEMLDYLRERSESFVAESVILEGGAEEERSDHPFDIISDFIDDFVGLKRNLLSRVSGWLLSEMREDKIDDFVQEMELNSFWLLDRREAIAQTLLKNVDFKNEFHCDRKFRTEEDLAQHRLSCGFRTVTCENEGCTSTFSAAHLEEHDSVCPFKILPCEQKCPEILIRREMDKHCITTCPMKLVNCPFYSIGCQASVPSCKMEEHFSNDVSSHVLYALLYLHKGVSKEDMRPRAQQVEQESSGRLSGIKGVRSFTSAVKNIDSKLGPFKIEKKQDDKKEESQEEKNTEEAQDKKEEAQEGKNTEQAQNKKEEGKITEEAKEEKNTEEAKEAKNTEEAREAKNTEEAKEANTMEEVQEANTTEMVQEAKSTEEVQEAKNTEEVQEAKNTEEVQEVKSTEMVQETKSTEMVQDANNTEKVQEAKNTEKVQEAKNTEMVEEAKNTEMVEEAKNTEKVQEAKNTEKVEEARNSDAEERPSEPTGS